MALATRRLAYDPSTNPLPLQEACSLAKRCLRRARQRGASRHSAARIAATVLTRAAVDRGSRDNVTVVVVDLSRCARGPCCLSRSTQACLSFAELGTTALSMPSTS